MSPGIENGNEGKTVLGYQRHIGRNESERIDSSILSTSEMKKPEQLSCSGFMFGGSVVRQINVRKCQKSSIFTINKQYVVKIDCSRTSCYIRKNLTFYAVPYAWRFV